MLCPGNTLPLRLTFRGDRALVQQALEAPAPLMRLIAVVCCQRSYFTPQLMLQRVGCVAEIRKMGVGGINLLAKGAAVYLLPVLLDTRCLGRMAAACLLALSIPALHCRRCCLLQGGSVWRCSLMLWWMEACSCPQCPSGMLACQSEPEVTPASAAV